MGKLFGKVNGWINGFFAYWKKPAKGRYISMKEAAAYSVGGMGIVGSGILTSYATLGAGAYISVALGISVRDIWLVGIINSIFVIARSPFISMMIDNTNTKMGKFRPYILWLTIPIILCFFAIGNIPFLFTNYTAKLIVFTVIFMILSLLVTTHAQAYGSMIQVITPNSTERNQLMSVGAFLYSLGPSIVQLFFPIFAQLLYGNAALNEPAVYKLYLPIFALIFLSVGLLVAFFTKERIIVSKKYVAKAKFIPSVKKVITNKYFWLANISGWAGALRLVATWIVSWICLYMLNSSASLGLFSTILGMASIPGMLLAPWFIKKFGKKNVVIGSYAITAIFSIPMLFALNSAAVLIICIFLMNLANAVNVVVGPVLTADFYDYQQFKTGDRLEGFMSNFGNMIGTAIGIGTSSILPFVYKSLGFVQNAAVLYDSAIRNPIFRWTVIIGIISSVLSIVPFLFWDLTEKKHGEIIKALEERAILENAELEKAEQVIADTAEVEVQ